jgi:type IV secretion system protein TrbC
MMLIHLLRDSRTRALLLLGLAASLKLQASATGLPWEQPMALIAGSITGPVAYAIGLIAVAASIGTIAYHGEIPEFARRIAYIGLCVGALITASPIMTKLFGITAAVV